MKKIMFSAILCIASLNLFAQKKVNQELLKRHEVKINAIYTIGELIEFGYEYLLNDESSVGADILFSTVKNNTISFAFTPHYRFYFGKKRAAGFFGEAFGMLNTTEDYYYYDYLPYPNYSSSYFKKNNTDFALGVAIGGKFITKRGYLLEIYLGLGRNLFNSSYDEGVPRLGITFGKRF